MLRYAVILLTAELSSHLVSINVKSNQIKKRCDVSPASMQLSLEILTCLTGNWQLSSLLFEEKTTPTLSWVSFFCGHEDCGTIYNCLHADGCLYNNVVNMTKTPVVMISSVLEVNPVRNKKDAKIVFYNLIKDHCMIYNKISMSDTTGEYGTRKMRKSNNHQFI